MSRNNWMTGSLFSMVLALLVLGCAGKAGSEIPFNATKGQHPTTWLADHWAEFLKAPNQCRTCHGSTTVPAQAGGVSKVSCFTCHATALPHPAGWAAFAQHGTQGAKLAPSADPKAMVGFAHCAKCHGTTYDNGPATSCKSCHTQAPHPSAPWTGTTASHTNHIFTDQANVPECFKCHAAGANSSLKPLTTPPAGTAPGCLNDTMCHSRSLATGTTIPASLF
jgi:hypothetical protein